MSRISLLIITLLSLALPVSAAPDTTTAIFAGGCFWCMESDFEKQPGVTGVVSGFTGGTLEHPTYKGNHQGHFEAVEITYEPAKISYQQLLDLYWKSVDPFDNSGQFCDKGFSYRSAIFPHDAAEEALARGNFITLAIGESITQLKPQEVERE
jgi:peptide-methionine (S)-S-oxide reductase